MLSLLFPSFHLSVHYEHILSVDLSQLSSDYPSHFQIPGYVIGPSDLMRCNFFFANSKVTGSSKAFRNGSSLNIIVYVFSVPRFLFLRFFLVFLTISIKQNVQIHMTRLLLIFFFGSKAVHRTLYMVGVKGPLKVQRLRALKGCRI